MLSFRASNLNVSLEADYEINGFLDTVATLHGSDFEKTERDYAD